MPTQDARLTVNVEALCDEDLARFAQLGEVCAALRELVARHFRRVERMLISWAHARRLQVADREDALQQTLFAFHEALATFDHARLAAGGDGRFQSYLAWVVRHRFIDYLRALRRRERRVDRSTRVDDLSDASARCGGNSAGDPARHVVLIEMRIRLDHAVCNLDEPGRRAWESLAAGMSLQATAASLGLSYGQAKHLRHRVRGQLADLLKDWKD